MNKKTFQVPSPFEFAILLTLIVLFVATIFTETSFSENIQFWGDGLWSLLKFMTQMCLILLGGYVVAVSQPVRAFLRSIVKIPRTQLQILLLTFFISAMACWLNWGLGLVVGAFFSLEMARAHKEANFPLLVAISYMGFIFWHGGLSGSIPLVISTPGNFSEKWMGATLGLNQTVFSSFNLSLIFTLLVVFSLFISYLSKQKKAKTFKLEKDFKTEPLHEGSNSN